jgi:serine/threonine protein kinase
MQPWIGGPCLGASLYEMILGFPPFNQDSAQRVFGNILCDTMAWQKDHEEMSVPCANVISKLLNADPTQRMNGNCMVAHPWVRESSFFIRLEQLLITSYFEPRRIANPTTRVSRFIFL